MVFLKLEKLGVLEKWRLIYSSGNNNNYYTICITIFTYFCELQERV